MAEAEKKQRSPPKSRASKKAMTVDETATLPSPTPEHIAGLAYTYWLERDRQDGQDQQDWLRAEQALKAGLPR